MDEIDNIPTISVFTTCKDGGRFLKETLDSIFCQSFTDFEVILVDGGSTDNTIDLLKEYKNEKRLQWSIEPDNYSGEGFFKALSLTKGKYLMCMPISDGYLDKNWFQKCVDVLEKDKEVSLVWGFPQSMSENGELGKISYNDFFDIPPPQKFDFHPFWLATGLMYCEMNYCVRSNVYKYCFPKYESDDFFDKRNPFSKFIYNFNINGYLPIFIPVVACFGRNHHNSGNNKYIEQNTKTGLMYLELINKYKNDILKGKVKHHFRDGNSNIIKSIEKNDLTKFKKEVNRYIYFTQPNLFFFGCKEKYNFYMLIKRFEKLIMKYYWKLLRLRCKI
jgi:glycosyltransferase involved in cell wall biosynthesis